MAALCASPVIAQTSTALHAAVEQQDVVQVNALLALPEGKSLLEARDAQGRTALLLAHGADLRSTNRFGGTALTPAAERGHVEAVRLLIDAGVDVNQVNRLGWTALLEAIILSSGGPAHQDIVRQLIAAGADVNLADHDGVTPLAHAVRRGHDASAAMLRAAGAR